MERELTTPGQILWTVVCRALVKEIARARVSRMSVSEKQQQFAPLDVSWARSAEPMDGQWWPFTEVEEQQCLVALQTVMGAMSALSHTSELMGTHPSPASPI